jgi:Mg2+-importing ATPase
LVLRTRKPAFHSKPGRLLLWATLGTSLVALGIPFLGSFASLFGFARLSLAETATILAVVAGYIAATEVAKVQFYRAAR